MTSLVRYGIMPAMTSPIFDPDRGKAAFDALMQRMQQLPEDDLASIFTHVESAAMAVLGVADDILAEAELVARFHALSAAEFDRAHLDQLPNIAWATLYADRISAKARALRSKAMLPAALVERAIDIRARMKKLCEYYLEDDPVAGEMVKFLRTGSGHLDLGNDLLGYAGLCRDHHDLVRTDRKHYQASDMTDAVSVGEQIVGLLGGGWTSEDRIAINNHARVWTLLHQSYNEVRDTGLWLLRRDKKRAARLFPALGTLGRSARSTEQTPPEPDETPVPSEA